MRVLVTGPRTWGVVQKECTDVPARAIAARKEIDALYAALDEIKPTELVSGGATGADWWAEKWAEANNTTIIVVKAPFEHLGPIAGTMRNTYMLEHHRPELVVACGSGTPGTENCVVQAKFRNIEVRRVHV